MRKMIFVSVLMLTMSACTLQPFSKQDNSLDLVIQSSVDVIPNEESQSIKDVATQADYDKIKTNMTYDEVVSVIGFDGVEHKVPEQKVQVGENEITVNGTTVFEWEGNGGWGSSITITFLDNKVFSKVDAFLE